MATSRPSANSRWAALFYVPARRFVSFVGSAAISRPVGRIQYFQWFPALPIRLDDVRQT
jgi:hypothetical protein